VKSVVFFRLPSLRSIQLNQKQQRFARRENAPRLAFGDVGFYDTICRKKASEGARYIRYRVPVSVEVSSPSRYGDRAQLARQIEILIP